MGRRDGENAAPTVIGTAKPSVNAHPITTAEHGFLTGPIEHGRQHRAPDGEREREPRAWTRSTMRQTSGESEAGQSPIPVSPARATLAGRIAPSTKLCTPISWTAVPTAAPRIPYWTSRDPRRPGDRTDNDQ